MRPVRRPSWSAESAFDLCLRRVGDKGLCERLKKTRQEVIDAADEYEGKAQCASLHEVRVRRTFSWVSEKELVDNYDNRLVRPVREDKGDRSKGAIARDIYDEIKDLPPMFRCPYCGHRSVETVDHFLPKAGYALLAVNPDNLVATCSDCNKAKGNYSPSSDQDCCVHPYFEAPDDDSWLGATVVRQDPPVVKFYVNEVQSWTDRFQARMQKHFDILGLASLYSKEAAVELSDIGPELMDRLNESGEEGVKKQLERHAKSRRASRNNSWQSAMYSALAASRWFCSEGVRYVPSVKTCWK